MRNEWKIIVVDLLKHRNRFIGKRKNPKGLVRYVLYDAKASPLSYLKDKSIRKIYHLLRDGKHGSVLDLRKILSLRKNNWVKKKYKEIRLKP